MWAPGEKTGVLAGICHQEGPRCSAHLQGLGQDVTGGALS